MAINPWLVKAGIEIIRDPNRAIKLILMIFLIVAGLLIILCAPILLFMLPNAEKEQYVEYLEAVKEIDSKVHIMLNWQELIAIDSVRLEQELEGMDRQKIIEFHEDNFIWEETIEVDSTCPVEVEGEIVYEDCKVEETVYHVRSLDEVMDIIGFDEEQKERVFIILETDLNEILFDGGVDGVYPGGSYAVSANVLRYEPLVRKYAIQNGIENYVTVLLALIQQESGGRELDVMQSSESQGLPPGTITDPEYSIEIGVAYFAERLIQANGDLQLTLQSYNFGPGFIPYALERGGYSKETAIAYSQKMALEMGWSSYGDINYVDNVMRYIGAAGSTFDFTRVYAIMKDLLGTPYLLGGRKPSDGGIDCSGLVEYAFGKIGINISGTAQDQYNKTVPINENEAIPGDLVFFDTGVEGRTISHVGMYIGNDMFIQSSSRGVNEASLTTWRNIEDYVFHGFRRIK